MTTITALPAAPNRATDDAATFSSKADTFVAALQTLVTETNLVATETNTAASSATAASAAATSVSGATAWAGTTVSYTLGNAVWSGITFQTYRLKIASKAANVANTDPSVDTASWALVNGTGDVRTTTVQTLTNKTLASPIVTGVISNPLGTAALPSYSFTGDLNTGAWSPSADAYAISTGGFERLRLDASGNVGIGTASPLAKLVVSNAGAQGFEFDPANGLFQVYNRSTSAYGEMRPYASQIRFFTGAAPAETMRLDTSGNLGLGVVPSAWGASERFIDIGNTVAVGRGSSAQALVAFNSFINSAGQYIYKVSSFASVYEQLAGQHKWYTAPSGTAGNVISFTQAMTLDASGRLGIGTASPTRPLDVNGSMRLANDSVVEWGGVTTSIAGSSSTNTLFFSTSSTERARIDSSGNFLVGTASNSLGGSSAIIVNGVITSGLPTSTGYNNINAASLEGASGRLIVNHINGTASASLYAGFGYNGSAIGSITQNGTTGVLYNINSDIRLKKDIAPAPSASADIDAIQVVSHGWKSAPDEQVKYGVIAQDLAQVAPQAVKVGDDGDEITDTWGVDYSKLVPMLIKEIQSLRARVAALEA